MSACRAGRSRHRRAASAVRTGTSAKASASAAIPGGPSAHGLVPGAAWRGGYTGPTVGGAGAAGGGMTHYPLGDCQHCGRHTSVGEAFACRLCIEQARMRPRTRPGPRPAGRQPVRPAAVPGQHALRAAAHPAAQARAPTGQTASKPARFKPLAWRQLVLFELGPDPELIVARALIARKRPDQLLQSGGAPSTPPGTDGANGRGTTSSAPCGSCKSSRTHRGRRSTPPTSLQLPRYGGNITSTLEVLAAAGLLNDDRLYPCRAVLRRPRRASCPSR